MYGQTIVTVSHFIRQVWSYSVYDNLYLSTVCFTNPVSRILPVAHICYFLRMYKCTGSLLLLVMVFAAKPISKELIDDIFSIVFLWATFSEIRIQIQMSV